MAQIPAATVTHYEYIGLEPEHSNELSNPPLLSGTLQLTEAPTRGNTVVVRRGRDESSETDADQARLHSREQLIDTNYGYSQVLVLFIGSIFSGMLGFTWGVFLPRLAEHFDESLALSAWPGALALTLRAACAPLAGAWAIRFGSQRVIMFGGLLAALGCLATSFATDIFQMYVTFGIVVGLGLSLTLYPTIGLINQWFDHKKAQMMGIGASGVGVGGLLYSPLSAYMIQTIGWRDTFRVSAIITLVLTVVAALLAEDRVPPKKTGARTKLPWYMFHDGRFTLTFVSNVCFSLGYAAPFFYLVTWSENHGLSHALAALGTGLLCGANAISKPMQGYMGDHIGREKVLYSALALAGTMQFLWTLCHDQWNIYLFAIVYGWATGGQFAMQACIISDWYHDRDTADIVGLSGSGRAIGEAVGPVMVGAVIESTPTGAFMMAGAFMLGSSLCCLLAAYWPAVTGRDKRDARTME
eukprot:Clim_evm22s220 gene=Clim_evmTU22s220